MRVDFAIIGAQKSGTSSLAAQLARHPAVCFSETKEPGFFNSREDWEASLDEYHALFPARPGQLCGEASTMYTFFPEFTATHDRLHAYNPDLRLIYIMRQPVERIRSHYSHRLVRRAVRQCPEIAVLRDPSFVNRSRYALQLKPYLRLFGPEALYLVIFEKYVRDPLATLAGVADFLGIDPDPFSAMNLGVVNESVGRRYVSQRVTRLVEARRLKRLRMSLPASARALGRRVASRSIARKPAFTQELRRILWSLLEDDVGAIERLIGGELSAWREPGLIGTSVPDPSA